MPNDHEPQAQVGESVAAAALRSAAALRLLRAVLPLRAGPPNESPDSPGRADSP